MMRSLNLLILLTLLSAGPAAAYEQDSVPPRTPYAEARTIIAAALGDCRLLNMDHTTKSLLACVAGNLKRVINGEAELEPAAPDLERDREGRKQT